MMTKERKILSTKYEMLNNIKALMTKIQNKMSFGIWIWNLEFV
jgi:REP element-mobilizing transposase RayT